MGHILLAQSKAALALACLVVGLGTSSALAARGDAENYLSLTGGVAFLGGDYDGTNGVNDIDGSPTPDATLSADTGWEVSLALGTYVRPFRLELQYTGQTNELNSWTWEGQPSEDADGTIHSNLFMLNAYYDLPIAQRLWLYIGGGVGGAWVSWDGNDVAGSHASNQDGWGLAYQGMAGIAHEVMPNVMLTAGYRVWDATEIGMDNVDISVPLTHIAEVGLRFNF